MCLSPERATGTQEWYPSFNPGIKANFLKCQAICLNELSCTMENAVIQGCTHRNKQMFVYLVVVRVK